MAAFRSLLRLHHRQKNPGKEPEGKSAKSEWSPISDQCKKKIHQKKGMPIEDQRLTFNDVPLLDEKTVTGSGIRNGDTIDLNPIII
jgi:Ubiquitin family